VLGAPDGYLSSIHTGDAAAAVVAAFTAPAGVYNIVDDVPLARREFADAFARAFGCRRLRIIPPALVRMTGGGAAQALLRSQRVRNAAFRDATGWAPAIPSAVEGWKAVAATREAARA
jgi:nucleoside-diphosphate-sugar epimerase